MTPRTSFIISDLHLGGRPSPGPGDIAAFRIMTNGDRLAEFIRWVAGRKTGARDNELVINGDFVDFLAEEEDLSDRSKQKPPLNWVPFVTSPERAVSKLKRVIDAEAAVFDALRELARDGSMLTIILGNHDIELAVPQVRTCLEERLTGGAATRVRFLLDGEAYRVGRALIEHGNSYDRWNVVRFHELAIARSYFSRGVPRYDRFTPPAGSGLVAEVMNPLKLEYPFVDLLKPENEAVIPILLALDPGLTGKIARVCHHALKSVRPRDVVPVGGDFRQIAGDAEPDNEEDALKAVLQGILGSDDASEFIGDLYEGPSVRIPETTQVAWGVGTVLSILRMIVSRGTPPQNRIRALARALRHTAADQRLFSIADESRGIKGVASALMQRDGTTQVVVFGHTHFAKQVDLPEGRYLNTGTWANLMALPKALGGQSIDDACAWTGEFVAALKAGGLPGLWFRPTYVKLEVDSNGAARAELFQHGATAVSVSTPGA